MITIPEFITIVLYGTIITLLIYVFYRYRKHQNESAKEWEELAKKYPEEFLADNEWVFVKYRDQVFPMTALEKKERWDMWNAKEKREFYQAIMRMIRKGRGKWEVTEDGSKMYVDNKSKRTGLVARYNDARRAVNHRHPNLKKQMQNYVSKRKHVLQSRKRA